MLGFPKPCIRHSGGHLHPRSITRSLFSTDPPDCCGGIDVARHVQITSAVTTLNRFVDISKSTLNQTLPRKAYPPGNYHIPPGEKENHLQILEGIC